MTTSPLAGKPAPRSILVNVPRLVTAYYALEPNPENPAERVSFGTSGHRGSSLHSAFNERHILATTQAICDYRKQQGIDGPLYLGMDTHALSEPARTTALEVLAGNGVEVMIDQHDGYTPTPVVSHAILGFNRGKTTGKADGIVITPSHNPPEDGGFKYNPPHGGPADKEATGVIESEANRLLSEGCKSVRRVPYARALRAPTTHRHDFVGPYVADLGNVVDMDVIRTASLEVGADPMGGSGIGYWKPIAERYKIKIKVVNEVVDPTFAFMCVDKDGKIRMDCSSPYAMASLIAHKDKFDVSFGNDSDYDRHGIVTRGAGLLNPNHYLAVAISYIFRNRPAWSDKVAVGKTLVSSSMIDRVAAHLGRRLVEVPVGFKWFVDGLLDGSLGFGGEESAGASFLRRDGTVWTTDKDGIVPALLASEILATTGRSPSQHHGDLVERYGQSWYARVDAAATRAEKATLAALSPDQVAATTLAGQDITARLTRAPGNDAPIGGLKVTTKDAWFAARPSGTEDVYKIYAESFVSAEHLAQVQAEAKDVVSAALAS